MIKFLIATAASWLVGLCIYYMHLHRDFGPVSSAILAYSVAIAVTAIFHMRYVGTQREFLARPRPWQDFAMISAAELISCGLAAWFIVYRITGVWPIEVFIYSFGFATIVRYILRKEFLQDIRGLRKSHPREAQSHG